MGEGAPVSRSERPRWAAPVAIAVVAHLAWMTGFSVPAFPARRVFRDETPARVVYSPSSARDIDARFIWSPVIFSLAGGHRDGSSGSGDENSLPPVVIPDDPPPFVSRAKPAPPAAILRARGVPPVTLWQAPVPRRSLPPSPVFEVDRMGEGPAPDPAWARSFSAETAGRHPWEATLQIEFGADGLPGSVLVEGPEVPAAARDHLSRTAFEWRRIPSEQVEMLLLRVRYSPPAVPAEKSAGHNATDGAPP